MDYIEYFYSIILFLTSGPSNVKFLEMEGEKKVFCRTWLIQMAVQLFQYLQNEIKQFSVSIKSATFFFSPPSQEKEMNGGQVRQSKLPNYIAKPR